MPIGMPIIDVAGGPPVVARCVISRAVKIAGIIPGSIIARARNSD
jgi:hypothetical protein